MDNAAAPQQQQQQQDSVYTNTEGQKGTEEMQSGRVIPQGAKVVSLTLAKSASSLKAVLEALNWELLCQMK